VQKELDFDLVKITNENMKKKITINLCRFVTIKGNI